LPDRNTPLIEFQSYVDYKSHAPGKPVFKYLNPSKFYKRTVRPGYGTIDWLDTTMNYPDNGTLIYLDNVGYANGSRMAVIEITWYVKFKGPHL